jgi:NAD(P)-dependent dehydrogenase (short-subunit alcohol dehydrogenase family)
MSDPAVMLMTGARKGIGRYLAEYYAAKGCMVVGWRRDRGSRGGRR